MCAGTVDVDLLTLTRGSPCSGTKRATRARLRVFKPPEEKIRQIGSIRSDERVGQTEDDDIWLLRHYEEIRGGLRNKKRKQRGNILERE